MPNIRKILRAVSEKTALPTNQPTNQPITNTDLIGPRWHRSKNFRNSFKNHNLNRKLKITGIRYTLEGLQGWRFYLLITVGTWRTALDLFRPDSDLIVKWPEPNFPPQNIDFRPRFWEIDQQWGFIPSFKNTLKLY